MEEQAEPQVEFHVSYLDTDSGLVRSEVFAEQGEAERFANARLKDEDSWAVVDAVAVSQARRLAA